MNYLPLIQDELDRLGVAAIPNQQAGLIVLPHTESIVTLNNGLATYFFYAQSLFELLKTIETADLDPDSEQYIWELILPFQYNDEVK